MVTLFEGNDFKSVLGGWKNHTPKDMEQWYTVRQELVEIDSFYESGVGRTGLFKNTRTGKLSIVHGVHERSESVGWSTVTYLEGTEIERFISAVRAFKRWLEIAPGEDSGTSETSDRYDSV